MNKAFAYLFFGLTLLALNSCADNPDTGTLEPIGVVEFNFEENFSETGNSLILNLKTEQEYDCFNYTISYTISENAPYTLNIFGVFISENCITSSGPATARIDLGEFKVGSHDFVIVNQQHQAHFTLDLSEEFITVSEPLDEQKNTSFAIHPEHLQIRRVPNNTLFGQMTFVGLSNWDAASSFMNALDKSGAIRISMPAGEYGHFYVHEGYERFLVKPEKFKILDEETAFFAVPLYYEFTDDFSQLSFLVDQYVGSVDQMRINLFHTSGWSKISLD